MTTLARKPDRLDDDFALLSRVSAARNLTRKDLWTVFLGCEARIAKLDAEADRILAELDREGDDR
jgi:hypothetical protein